MCIDDFATKKRESYGTLIVDIKTHRIIDMIDSRDCSAVTEWLKTFPNINVVPRDGSLTYNNAISHANPKAIQVSDRFHLLKNLTMYYKDYLIKIFKPKVPIEALETKIITDDSAKSHSLKNTILYDYDNGLAEGSVNNLKVIKRIMYGRYSFDTLRKKVLRLELKRKIN